MSFECTTFVPDLHNSRISSRLKTLGYRLKIGNVLRAWYISCVSSLSITPVFAISNVICSSPHRLWNCNRSSYSRRGLVCCSCVLPNACILLRIPMCPGMCLSSRKPCRFDLPVENNGDEKTSQNKIIFIKPNLMTLMACTLCVRRTVDSSLVNLEGNDN